MKPSEADYAAVERHLPRYVVGKLKLWEGSNTWYDNECLYTLGAQHEKWGSLRLMSQEGMEAWQKKLNELRTAVPSVDTVRKIVRGHRAWPIALTCG